MIVHNIEMPDRDRKSAVRIYRKLRALDRLPGCKGNDPAVAVGTVWSSKGTGIATLADWCFYAEELN